MPEMKLEISEYKNQLDIPLLYFKVLVRFAQYSVNGKLSVKTCRQILSWDFKLKKEESNKVLKEMKKLGLISFISNHTIEVNLTKSFITRLKRHERVWWWK